jgi:hypothetical protein
VGKKVLRDLVPLPVVPHFRSAVAEEPEDGTNEENKLRYIEERGPVNFLPQVLVFGMQDRFHKLPVVIILLVMRSFDTSGGSRR